MSVILKNFRSAHHTRSLIYDTIKPILFFFHCAIFVSQGLHAESFDVGERGEIVVHTDIQLDSVLDEKCGDRECPSRIDGFRVADLYLRYNHFETTTTNIFGEVSLDYSADMTTGFVEFNPELENVIRAIDDLFDGVAYDETVEVAVLGVRAGTSEFKLGRQKPSTDRFSPLERKYLNFSLSAFDDDRVGGTDFSYGDMISAASYRQTYSAILFLGVERSDGTTPDMDYELFYESRIKGLENAVLTFATRSSKWGPNRSSFKAHGLKLHLFENNGNAYTGSISVNDLGKYFEFVFSRDWAYRHRASLGTSNFSSDPDNGFERLDNPPGSAQFYFVNYTYAISRYLNTFAEIGTYHEGGEDSRNVVVGLRYFL